MKSDIHLRLIFAFALLILMSTLHLACTKSVVDVRIPTVTTKSPTGITTSSADCGGFVTSDGGASVTENGLCYSTNPNPTVADFAVTGGSGTGNFQCSMTGLNPATKYYVRAYAFNSAGIGYGNQVIFTTLSFAGIPTVKTAPMSNITEISAIGGGNVTDQGTSAVIARGLCWSTNPLPSISENYTEDGSGLGSYTSNIDGLIGNVIYYVRAYATNSLGTAYGSQISFKASSSGTVPTLSTDPVTEITKASAISGGKITSEGSSPVTGRGVCWNTTPNPVYSDSHTSDGTGTGIFTSNLTGLIDTTTYYVRAYAMNLAGVAYGNEMTFTTTEPAQICESGFIYQGRIYHGVKINSRCWLKENLNVGKRINGSQTQNAGNDTIEKYCYDDLESNCDIYGGLYQWDEMMKASTTPGSQGICPTGWHLPTDEEYAAMANFLGGDTLAGGKMKETGTIHWLSPNNGATNSSGFTALPGGYRDVPDKFKTLKYNALYWSSSENGGTVAWYRSMYFSSEILFLYSGQKISGFSVRCLKD